MAGGTGHEPWGELEDTGTLTRQGVRLGIDVGTVRIGVARSDPGGILATPVTTLRRDRAGADLATLARLVSENDVLEVVVGLPTTLRGTAGPAVAAARDFGDRLAALIDPIPVVYVDERFTTAAAHRALAASGRNAKQRREIVDQAAAVDILQTRLDGLAGDR